MVADASLERLLRASPSLRDSLRGAARAAATDASVLVLGESGAGRTSVARALHAASPRRAAELVELDAAVVPTSLFESELFGHRAGAFTGAEASSTGRVERAEGGTLLLDHVEELPLSLQPKLLRLLAERRYAPLGGRETQADLRFLAVGSEDLPERIERGAFRADLFYRLEVLTFRLPPLRERSEDLSPICEYLLADLGGRFGRGGELRLSPRAEQWFSEYSWPGNLRELRNVLERAMIADDGDELDPRPPDSVAGARPRSLAEVEAEQIRRALGHTRGHQGRAAEILGISRKALWEKRKRHGIP